MGKPRDHAPKKRPDGLSKYALKQLRKTQEALKPANEPVPPPPPPAETRSKSQQVRMRITKEIPEKGFVLENNEGRTTFLPLMIARRDYPDAKLNQELECVVIPHKHRPEDFFVIKILPP